MYTGAQAGFSWFCVAQHVHLCANKPVTTHWQQNRINDCIYRIHRDIGAPLSAQQLAAEAHYSPHHFHRVFKQQTGTNVANYIRRARLEHAANRLMFETGKTVIRIAQDCGFQSPASFSQAFTKHFGCAPSQWRKSGYQTYMHRVQMQQQSGWMGKVDALTLPDIAIQQCAEQRIAYVRHLGYDRSICNAWQYLRAWAYTVGIDWQAEQMIGLHHSNPDIIPLAECRYVAGITTNQTILKHGAIGLLKIPAGSYAVMRVTGQLGALLPMIHTFYHQWLPGSGYNLGSTPGYARYQKNQFLDDNEQFDLDFCVPVSVL